MSDPYFSEYGTGIAESTQVVPPRKWRLALISLALTLLGGVILIVALANGAGNLVYPPRLIIDLDSDANLPLFPPDQLLVSSLSSEQAPIVIEVSASAQSLTADWGIWIRTQNGILPFRLRSDGYFSLTPGFGWQQFIHIRPQTNTLTLSISPHPNRYGTLRINQEIAWSGSIAANVSEWGILRPENDRITWHSIRLYISP